MNKQNSLDPSELQSFEAPPQLFYLENETNLAAISVESKAFSHNATVNFQKELYSIPVMTAINRQDQVSVYMESINETDSLHQIHVKKYDPAISHLDSLPVNIKTDILTSTSATLNTEIARNTENNQLKGFVRLLDRVVPPRAVAVLPPALHYRREYISPRRSLPQRVRFGPVQGVKRTVSLAVAHTMALKAAKSNAPIFLLNNNDSIIHIDVSDKDKSNWFSLLPLGNQSTANVWLYEEDNNLFGITVHSISAGTPLALGYTKAYIEEYGLSQGLPTLDITEDLMEEPQKWSCHECKRVFTTSTLLRRHVEQCHTDDVTVCRRRYHCRHCTRSFTRLCSLKRHMARYCTEKVKTMKNSNKTIPAEDAMNTSLNIEDNRLPSDESLQNYTNGLDFSTSLFDTDRIPGLDISGSSRSETEFNPYALPYRDENAVTPDLGFDKLSNELEKSQNDSKEIKQPTETPKEPLLISCHYCKQTILKEKKQQHLSECPDKRLECECGRTFANKEMLAKHIRAEHLDTTELTMEPVESDVLEYKCEKCQLLFKRRGMLVNHMWREHRSLAAVPLQRRVRHYPCAACPKLYRTAAKRDTHHAAHHPGTPACGRYAIDGGRRTVAPAACTACPRQYATRAKLLQHVRQRHPEQALPTKHSSKAKAANQNDYQSRRVDRS